MLQFINNIKTRIKARMNQKKAIAELWQKHLDNPELGKSVIEEAKRRCAQMEVFGNTEIDPRWECEKPTIH